MVNGDYNTSFYHTSTLARRKPNRILTLQDSNGVWLTKAADVANHIREGFISLFTFGMEIGYRRPWNIPNWPVQISEEDAVELSCFVSDQEVKDALWSLKPFKALGPNGLHGGFFQRFWLLVGETVTNTVKGAFTNGKIMEHINKTLITLIPKHTRADRLGSFLPISLCNTIYKIITKIIVARFRPFLSNLIFPMQVAFVSSRKGLDNVIITQEILHTMSRKKGNVGYMANKIDLEKTYDRLEWSFVRDTLKLFNIPDYLVNVIMSYISSSSVAVLFNGGALEESHPMRGIRQGDPLSPYLFIMCMEVLRLMIKDKCDSKLWDLVKASRGRLAFSHLLFADDLILFGKADKKNYTSIKEALDSFCELSRQKVNNGKSRVYFSPNISEKRREELCSCLDLHSTPNLGKYLGFSLKLSGTTNQEFDFVIERAQGRLSGWKSHLLSFAGRVVLTQLVLSAIPVYVMQGTMLPTKTLEAIDRVSRNFVWRSSVEKRKLHTVSWAKITRPKKEGGLGLIAAKPKN